MECNKSLLACKECKGSIWLVNGKCVHPDYKPTVRELIAKVGLYQIQGMR